MKQVTKKFSAIVLLVILCAVSGEKIRGGTTTSTTIGGRGSHGTREHEGQAEQSSNFTSVLVPFFLFAFMVIGVYVYASVCNYFQKSASATSDGETVCSQNEEEEDCEGEGNETNEIVQEEA